MKNSIKIRGKIKFDPPDKTNKHRKQGVWKKIAYVSFGNDLCDYYKWFIYKRYSLPLSTPLRKAHVTFINDSLRDMGDNASKWDELKKKWNNKYVEVELDLTPKTDDINWWFNVTEESRIILHNIRSEIGLSRPYWGLHMTIGYARDGRDPNPNNDGSERIVRYNEAHSKYIHKTILLNIKNSSPK